MAFQRGYRINADGDPVNPGGRVLKGYANKDRKPPYRSISIKHTKCNQQVRLHVLAAIQKFGILAVSLSPQVRHLDGDHSNNKLSNIDLGTAQQNSMDRPAEQRLAHARKASASIQRKDWPEIENDRAVGMTYNQLAAKYKLSKGTLSYHFSFVSKHRAEAHRKTES
jgi:hypothetical protein